MVGDKLVNELTPDDAIDYADWWRDRVLEDGVAAIGSGGNFALSAARALMDIDMDAEKIVRKAMAIAADICIHTNHNVRVLEISAATNKGK